MMQISRIGGSMNRLQSQTGCLALITMAEGRLSLFQTPSNISIEMISFVRIARAAKQ